MLALGGEERRWGEERGRGERGAGKEKEEGSLLSPAESSWRSLAAGEGTTWQGPL